MVKWPVKSVLQRYWKKNDTWFDAKVIKERHVTVGKRKQREVRVQFEGERSEGNDRWLAENSSDLREKVKYIDTFSSDECYLEDDQWEVERVLGERGAGKKKEFLVRWHGAKWGREEHDTWLQPADVEASLLENWELAKAAAVQAAARFSDEERVHARSHAQATIDYVALKLIDKLRSTTCTGRGSVMALCWSRFAIAVGAHADA